ncbi:Reverse transcriptase zinc-binding domain [Arabidopsis thaliana x Arabidopsis arenosa]|uniref:Reverse transcriptase zinc-binding domain n=1 Tax=Arabidopsis thaliana x Arabidopsis arenosa TaxID=1240361 RepID=A0A8T1YDJ2_9BRAS|nr:Reverse transcriptase zinc-binding domain [Arabidopsis thaliana x Arabidopsis arenosa]
MMKWNHNANSSCVLCSDPFETRDHLFFMCPYSRKVWVELVEGLLLNRFTTSWQDIMKICADKDYDKTKRFLLRYVFQNAIHSIWRERNARRHREQPSMPEKLVKLIDKNLRNRMSTIPRRGEGIYAKGLQVWFASRRHQ